MGLSNKPAGSWLECTPDKREDVLPVAKPQQECVRGHKSKWFTEVEHFDLWQHRPHFGGLSQGFSPMGL